ncbi:ATP-dependent RNA helicase HelY [Nocardioides scoriae]|uniref:ATP-dependent RNA helicase HelY n=1 Tax=Nocardioides scoriae TaxID=642780 RepID=A0A1H1NK99_9ACTN|nr:DEAD/DEAH box helicase [Nocardioides scoriae]SDR99115.1 ATP-dependent RNA helicase HelY [Nocardioides scoriae]
MTDDQSASARYARYRRNREHPMLADFASRMSFTLDDFQVRACRELEEGRSVLVAAPTGSGKTIVGEFAVHLALETGRKAFYTTPIKALSNQKFHDLSVRYGADNVGLLTGDNSINGEAPVVVMTTEVLRNMLYAGSRTLETLGFVVMDEVHYLADRMRGAVWEEVIIHLPDSVAVASLSATVSNAEEFGEWLGTVRGETTTIVEERRPVPLYQHVIAGRRMYDLFADEGSTDPAELEKHDREPKVNPQLVRLARDDWARGRMKDRRAPRGGKRPQSGSQGSRGAWTPTRAQVVEQLDRAGLLPAIVFIFSRVGCNAAVQQCLDANLKLTTPAERDEIHAFVEERCANLPDEDLQVLGYHEFLDGLTRGIAAHHAGMLPTFKECVEELFLRGLCRVVFATETLALGINMPARSVVIEKLSKWNGETHADLSPGEYTQLTGRAGRRGIDVEGHGVVLWQQGLDPSSVAGLASTRTYPLRSSFRPSYNMAVNLVHQFGRERARELLESSFAQFQADKAVVGLARQLRKSEDALAGYAEAAACDKGDFMQYAGLRHQLSETERDLARSRRFDRRQEVVDSLEGLRPGDVIDVPAGRFSGLAVVIDPGTSGSSRGADREGPRPYVLTADRHARRLSIADFPTPVGALTRVKVPKNFNGRDPQARRDLASTLRNRTNGFAPPPGPGGVGHSGGSRSPVEDRRIAELRRQLRDHPCHECPDREDHARWAERYFKLDRDARTLKRRIEQRTNTIARQFDRVCDVLAALGYLEGSGDSLAVTDRGRTLMRIYNEMDLVTAESLRAGLWDALDPSELAAVLSTLVYESRRPDDAAAPRLPVAGPVRQVLADMVSIWGDLDALEREHRLDQLHEPDLGFVWAAWRWAEGDELDDILRVTDLTAGDFVRWVKQLLDLADQVADASGSKALRTAAREASSRLRRGVVAYSSVSG